MRISSPAFEQNEPINADEKTLLASMSGHILDSAELVGTYERGR